MLQVYTSGVYIRQVAFGVLGGVKFHTHTVSASADTDGSKRPTSVKLSATLHAHSSLTVAHGNTTLSPIFVLDFYAPERCTHLHTNHTHTRAPARMRSQRKSGMRSFISRFARVARVCEHTCGSLEMSE